jgi:hypothetical protein
LKADLRKRGSGIRKIRSNLRERRRRRKKKDKEDEEEEKKKTVK